MMKINGSFLSITIVFCMGLIACANYVGPDETGRICEPGVMLADSFGCLPGCDLDASAYFCTADGRGQECRIVAGRVCRTDPGCPGGGASCSAGVGACQRFGTTSCPAGSSTASICSAVAGSPVSEICGDAIDNDCDGSVDDGCSTCTPTGVEICDNLDNDCDGAIDEGCDDDGDDHCDGTMNMGPSGSLTCPRTPPGRTVGDDCDDSNPNRCPSMSETCNMVDDNCNGIVDEALGSTVAGSICPVTCTPVTEVCNGRDDDCDGSSDEGGVCGPTCGTGRLLGEQICVEYTGSFALMSTYGGSSITAPNVALFDCAGNLVNVSAGSSECVTLTEACNGWLATTTTRTATTGSLDLNEINSFYRTSGATTRGSSASDIGARVYYFRSGVRTDLPGNKSWVAYDPTGTTVPTGASTRVGERVIRLEIPVREDCLAEGMRPPDRF
jgi:hypothetical protein